MADVTVEFGAQDVGLEKTLKAVQAEMSELQTKVKSGELSFEELERTMRKIGQAEGLEKKLKAMGDEASGTSPKIERLTRDLQDVGDKTAGLGGFFDSSFQKIAGAFTVGNIAAAGFNKAVDLAFTAAQAVVQSFGEALDLGGRLNELSARTGESAGKLLVLETAFKNAGLGADTVGTAINKLQNFMQDATNGGDKQVGTMNRLGISLADLQGKTPTEQMQLFADKIAAIDDPTQRAATASDVFGDKLGGKLLPLLTDFSPALEDARDKVGSMEQVMDENAATFDAAGETVDAVKGKMVAFAAGVLSEVIPAVDNLGASMERVDAAGLGQQVGQYLTPILTDLTDAMRGAIAIIGDFGAANTKAANDTGILGTAYRGVTTSLDGFNQMMADTFNKFTPFGYVMETLVGRGKDLRESQDSAAEGIANAGAAAGDASGKIGEVGTASDTATAKVGALGTQADATGESIASSFSLNSEFAPQLDSVASAWGGINEQVTGNKELLTSNLTLGESIVGKADEQKQSIGGINEQLDIQKQFAKTIDDTYGKHAEKAAQVAEKQAEIAAKEAERKEHLQESLNFDLKINQAKASGNIELAASLESQKEFNAELKKAIDAGMGEPQARAFAQAMVDARDAANSIANRNVVVTVTTKVDDSTWKDLLASLALNADPKSVEVAMKITGKDNLNDAYKTLQDMELINKNYQAAFTVIGAQSLEELKANLDGIPTESQRQLAMQITGEDNLKDAVQNLERFTNTHTANLLLESQGFERMDDFQNQLDGITGEKRTSLILEALGVQTLEEAKSALDAIITNDGKSVNVTANVDTAAASASIQSLYDSANTTFANPVVLTLEGDQSIAAVRASAEGNFAAPIAFNLDGNQTIQNVRAAVEANFANPISLTMSGSQAANDVYSTVNSAFDAPVELEVNAEISSAQTEVASLGNDQTAKINADTATAEESIASLGEEITIPTSADTTSAQEGIDGINTDLTMDLNADTSIENIRTSLKEGIELDISAKSGTSGMLEQIKTLVSGIQDLVAKIEPKLPVAALVA